MSQLICCMYYANIYTYLSSLYQDVVAIECVLIATYSCLCDIADIISKRSTICCHMQCKGLLVYIVPLSYTHKLSHAYLDCLSDGVTYNTLCTCLEIFNNNHYHEYTIREENTCIYSNTLSFSSCIWTVAMLLMKGLRLAISVSMLSSHWWKDW